MSWSSLEDLQPILPELVLTLTVLCSLMIGVFRKENVLHTVSYLALAGLAIAGACSLIESPNYVAKAYQSFLITNYYIQMVQFLVIATTFLVLFSTFKHLVKDEIGAFEYPILCLLSCLGMIILVSSNDLITFFLGLELQSLPVYVMVAMARKKPKVSEAAVKYFVLGIVATAFLLFGSSYIYGLTGTTSFEGIALALKDANILTFPFVFAFILLVSGLSFKISAVPYHMWTPDVYEGSPTPVTLFIASAPKLAALAFFMRFLFGPLSEFMGMWQPTIQAISIASMVLGVFGALYQTNIKRLLAYSTISHIGYALVGVAASSTEGVKGVLVYITIYVIMTLGVFGILLNLRIQGKMPEDLDSLKGLSKTYPKMAAALGILVFSLAGIPPLAGFFGKFLVFVAAVNAGLYTLAIIGVLASVVGAAYYLRIIKLMYFDEPTTAITGRKYDPTPSKETSLVVLATTAFSFLFFVQPDPLIEYAEKAAAVLFEKE